jgi:hypothetical protein
MPGPGHRFTPTEDMLAKRIARQYEMRGYDSERAKQIGYATVTKLNSDSRFRHIVDHHANKLEKLHKGNYILTRIKKSKKHIKVDGKDILVS